MKFPCNLTSYQRQQAKFFFSDKEWRRNSPDLIAYEQVGEVIKDKIENLILQELIHHYFSRAMLKQKIISVFQNIRQYVYKLSKKHTEETE